jgi:pyridoxamine 5'-phosphate oxidase
MKERFSHGEIPLPPAWGGYRVLAERYEFWQGRPNRLHDRFCYRRPSNGEQGNDHSSWLIERLAP